VSFLKLRNKHGFFLRSSNALRHRLRAEKNGTARTHEKMRFKVNDAQSEIEGACGWAIQNGCYIECYSACFLFRAMQPNQHEGILLKQRKHKHKLVSECPPIKRDRKLAPVKPTLEKISLEKLTCQVYKDMLKSIVQHSCPTNPVYQRCLVGLFISDRWQFLFSPMVTCSSANSWRKTKKKV